LDICFIIYINYLSLTLSFYLSIYLSIYLSPGTTYRTREEVGGVRTARDPIDYIKKLLLDNDFQTADEIKKIEKDIRSFVSNINNYFNFILIIF
jgi:hypothetical protein